MALDLNQFNEHLARVKASINRSYSLAEIPQWICENTLINNEPYSYKDHEFQLKIISDESVEVNVMKCAQVGLSEIMIRWLVAVLYNFPEFKAILTFPFGGDAEDFAKTRVDPFIKSSPLLSEAVNPKIDNSRMKMILQSMLYFRGTNGKTAALSIPADAIVSDEIDRSNPDILTQYTSRLTHSPYKWRRNFSTPTVKGYGIDLLMSTSRRFVNMCKCDLCGHGFVPDFFEHVKIPDYDGDLKALNKNTISRTRYLEAALRCPRCGKKVNLQPEHREWVLENNEATFEAAGYMVSPFDAPNIITPVSLLKAMVSYNRMSEFINQNLGRTSEEVSESLTLADIERSMVITDMSSTQLHAMGCDMGLICYVMIGRLTLEDQFIVVHRERVLLGEFERRRKELARQYNVAITVCDSQPYVDLILRMQKYDKNLYGGLFVVSKGLEVYKIKMFDGDASEGKLPIHQAQINREKALDEILGLFKRGDIVIQRQEDELDEEFEKHLLDMKRVQTFDSNQEMTYTWVKSHNPVDHWHFTTLYCYTACRLRGVISRSAALVGGPLIRRFKVSDEEAQKALSLTYRR